MMWVLWYCGCTWQSLYSTIQRQSIQSSRFILASRKKHLSEHQPDNDITTVCMCVCLIVNPFKITEISPNTTDCLYLSLSQYSVYQHDFWQIHLATSFLAECWAAAQSLLIRTSVNNTGGKNPILFLLYPLKHLTDNWRSGYYLEVLLKLSARG